MKKYSSILIALACLAMIISFFVPLWTVTLDAPQYPEGLTLQIWLSKLSGDVDIISELNHYIGMKKISVEMFPEFGYMSTIVIAVIVAGLITAIVRKKWLFIIWFVAFFAIAAIGIYDFWSWEYDYGHNLDPRAAIKIADQYYQPPLIGCKQLLNFNACSFPAGGCWVIIISGTISFLVFAYEMFFNRKKSRINLI